MRQALQNAQHTSDRARATVDLGFGPRSRPGTCGTRRSTGPSLRGRSAPESGDVLSHVGVVAESHDLAFVVERPQVHLLVAIVPASQAGRFASSTNSTATWLRPSIMFRTWRSRISICPAASEVDRVRPCRAEGPSKAHRPRRRSCLPKIPTQRRRQADRGLLVYPLGRRARRSTAPPPDCSPCLLLGRSAPVHTMPSRSRSPIDAGATVRIVPEQNMLGNAAGSSG